MKLILNNPYRIAGLLVGATAREQTRQITRLKQYLEAEQQPEEDFSFPILGNFNRTLKQVEEAESNLNFDSDKIKAALFWFWNGNPITDEVAFDALKDGDIEEAYQIWDKLITETKEDGQKFWKPVTNKNLSAFHNRAVLALITDKGSFVSAVMANIKFIESDFFGNFIKYTVDETYRVVKKDLQLDFLKTIAENADNKKITDLIKYLNDYDFSAKEDFMKEIVQKPISQIEKKIETAKNKRKASKANAAKAGQELFTSTANDLTQLKSIVGANDIKYSSVADKVANEILQCSIDYFNYSQERENSNSTIPQEHCKYTGESSDNYAETAMKLAKQAEMLAVGNLTKDRVKDSINTLAEIKERDLNEAIAFLKSIKGAFEKNEKEIKLTVKNMSLGPNESINWGKVNQVIYDSINWDMVVRDVQEVITQKHIEKIKQSDNTAKVREYKALVVFLMGKLNYPNKKKLEYLKFWEEAKPTRPISATQPIAKPQQSNTRYSNASSSKSTSEDEIDDGCLVGIVLIIIVALFIILVIIGNR